MNDSETDSQSIKALIVFRENGETDNLFVPILCDAIRMAGIDVRCSQKEFWESDTTYDIIHFQWPEEVVGWICEDHDVIRRLKERIAFFRSRGAHFVYTRHNIRPHYANEVISRAYDIIESESDIVVHMGHYSLTEFIEKHPGSRNVVIPHHIYQYTYKEDISIERARQYLNLPQEAFIVTAFGKFRNREEIRMVASAFCKWNEKNKLLLAPRLYPFSRRNEYGWNLFKRWTSRLGYYLAMPLLNRLLKFHAGANDELIDNCDLPYYIAASDVIFIQRKDILNSGNVPLGFLFHKVVVGPTTVIIAFFNLFTDMGISPAIIQHKALTKEELSDIFSFTVWTGIAISLLFFAASWLIADYYDSQILRILCQLLSVNLFFASATIVPGAMFYRNKEFKYIAVRSFTIQIAGGAGAVTAALCGAGLYALIITPIISSILIFVISYQRYPQRLRFTWGLTALRKIFSYSAYQFLFNVINYFSRNLDKLLIGKHMSMSDLGYYEKSYRLMMLPLQNITQVITPVMHPIFSDFQDDKAKLASSYERIVRILSFIGLPMSVLLFFTAQEVTLIIFGNQWLPSVPVFRILSLSVGVQIILSSSGSIFQAAGDTRSLFICGVFSSTLNVAGMLIGIFYFGTLTAVATCIVLTFTVNFVQCYWQMYHVTFRRKVWTFVRQLLSPLAVSGLMTACLLPVQYTTEGMNIFVTIITKSIISFIIFGGYIQATHEYDIIGKVKKIAGKYIKKQNKQL